MLEALKLTFKLILTLGVRIVFVRNIKVQLLIYTSQEVHPRGYRNLTIIKIGKNYPSTAISNQFNMVKLF